MGRREGEDVWRDRLRRHQSDGGSIAAFCRAEGVSHNTFYKWRDRIGEIDAESLSFVEVTPPVRNLGSFELVFPSGLTLRVPARYDATALRQLVASLSDAR